MSEWHTISLREANVSLIDCEHRTPAKAASGVPYIAIPQIKNGRIDITDARRITQEHFMEWTRKAAPQPYDVVLSRRCNPGETAFVPPGLDFALGQNLVLLRADGTKIYPPFLRWLVRGTDWWEQIGKFINVGAVFDSLKCADIPRFRLLIPPLSEQRVISHILGALDDKIELNQRINETLEAIARAIFKSWFLDFDPVRAKSEGRQPFGMNTATASLFPDSFEDSALGKIPKGWKAARLEEIAENPRRGVHPKKAPDETPYIGLEHMPRKSIVLASWGHSGEVASNKFEFRQGEILFGKLRPYFHKVGVAPLDGVCSTDILVITARSEEWYGILLGHASSEEFVAYTDAASTGTKMPRTNWQDMARYEIALPDSRLASTFSSVARDLVERIRQNILEFHILSAIRDALLPKLISGEIRVRSSHPAEMATS